MLQNGLLSDPGPVTRVAFGAFVLLWASMVLAAGLWVARDARARGSDRPMLWSLASVFTPVGLPYYLFRRFRRNGLGERASSPTRLDRLLATWTAATLAASFVGSVLSPPDPFSQLLYTLGTLCVTLPLAYLFLYCGGYRRATKRIGL